VHQHVVAGYLREKDPHARQGRAGRDLGESRLRTRAGGALARAGYPALGCHVFPNLGVLGMRLVQGGRAVPPFLGASRRWTMRS